MVNPIALLEKYYVHNPEALRIVMVHSRQVAAKALQLATAHPEYGVDLSFVVEAAMLHDIGVYLCYAPGIGCHGDKPYVCHGYLGSELLQKEGLPRHALVCERHTGTGITVEMIRRQNLQLPLRDMVPLSKEERLICFADKFFSKTRPTMEKRLDKVRADMASYGEDSAARFESLCTEWL